MNNLSNSRTPETRNLDNILQSIILYISQIAMSQAEEDTIDKKVINMTNGIHFILTKYDINWKAIGGTGCLLRPDQPILIKIKPDNTSITMSQTLFADITTITDIYGIINNGSTNLIIDIDHMDNFNT